MIFLPMPAAPVPVITQPAPQTALRSAPLDEWLSFTMPDVLTQTQNQGKGHVRGTVVSGTPHILQNAYRNQQSDVMIHSIAGVVEVLLPDDLEGSRHQRFIIRVASGQTLLVVHNIDLAARIDSLREGDHVTVTGEYEWNDRGGLIHWTHKDPRNVHEAGWIDHNNVRYE